MKYFLISDVHGEYRKMITALEREGFDRDADTLVSLGDPFDRGSQSFEVLDYIMGCPNRIIVRGNHDDRLWELMRQSADYNECDTSNGVPATVKSFMAACGEPLQCSPEMGLFLLANDGRYTKAKRLFTQYIDESVAAVEFATFVGVHGWVPVHRHLSGYSRNPDWRHGHWGDAVWCNTPDMMAQLNLRPEKPLVCGHWWAYDMRRLYMEGRPGYTDVWEPGMPYSWVEGGRLVATFIDGCANHGQWPIPVLTYETDEEPQLIRWRR